MQRKPRLENFPKKRPRKVFANEAEELDIQRPVSKRLSMGGLGETGKPYLDVSGCCGFFREYCRGEAKRCRYEGTYDVHCAMKRRMNKSIKKRPR